MRPGASIAMLLLGAPLLVGCKFDAQCKDMELSRLQSADRVVVVTNNMQELRVITDAQTVAKLGAFAVSHPDNWEVPLAGPPVALVRGDFYRGSQFLGDLGLGSDFISAQGCGHFQSRSVSAKDREALLKLLGIADPYRGNP